MDRLRVRLKRREKQGGQEYHLSHARNHSNYAAHRTHLCNCAGLLQEVIEVKFRTHDLLLQIFSFFLLHLVEKIIIVRI